MGHSTVVTEVKKTRPPFPWWAAPLLALLPAVLACFRIVNRDIGFHVATGRAIERLGEIPQTNVLSFTNPEHPWVLHQWIPAYAFFRMDRAFGPEGLVVAKVLLVFVTFTFLAWALRARGVTAPTALFWFVSASVIAAPRFFIRPYLFSMLFLAIVLWGLSRAFSRGDVLAALGRRRETVIFALCAVLPAILSSVFHAGFVYAWIVLASFLVVVIAAALLRTCGAQVKTSDTPVVTGERAAITAVIAGAVLAGASAVLLEIANPHGIEVLTLPFRFSRDAYFYAHLEEYRPPPFDLARFPALWLAIGLSAASASFVCVRAITRRKMPGVLAITGFLVVGAFTYLVLRHIRIAYPYALVAAVFVAPWTDEMLAPVREKARRIVGPILVVAALALAGHALDLFAEHAEPGLGLDSREYPSDVMSFVRDHDLPDNVYISDSWGGYWLWEFYPDRRVFYDNRLEAYPFEFIEHDYQGIRYGEEGWAEKLERYEINTVVLKYSTDREMEFLDGRPGIRRLLFSSPDWQLLWWDDHGMVFLRSELVDTACPDCGDFKLFYPDRLEVTAGSPQSVYAELESVNAICGPSARWYGAMVTTAWLSDDRQGAQRWLNEGLAEYPRHPELLRLVHTVGADAPSP